MLPPHLLNASLKDRVAEGRRYQEDATPHTFQMQASRTRVAVVVL